MEEFKVEELDRAVGPGEVGADIRKQISSLSVAEKIRLLNTTSKKKVRAMLVRDPNTMISASVIASPNVMPEEIQEFARTKDLHSDVLKAIADHRRYSSDRLIVWNLLNNPKVPIVTSRHLIRKFGFTWKELTSIVKNRDLPQALRNLALRLSQTKRQ